MTQTQIAILDSLNRHDAVDAGSAIHPTRVAIALSQVPAVVFAELQLLATLGYTASTGNPARVHLTRNGTTFIAMEKINKHESDC